jgi:peptide/nickel transport system permease protein
MTIQERPLPAAVAQHGQLTLPERRSGLAALVHSRAFAGVFKYPPSLIAVIILMVVLLGATIGPSLMVWNPDNTSLREAFIPPTPTLNPNAAHIFGTDSVGRDVLVRLMTGARVSLLIGFVGASGAAIIGIFMGLTAGWFRGITGATLMRAADLQIAFPFLIFAITVTAVLGPGLWVMLVLFCVWSWGGYARVTEGLTLSLAHSEYVEAARVMGAGTPRILIHHILPQLISPILVLWSFGFAILIIAEASLSFLGMGIKPPQASWGVMLAEGRQYLRTAWWLAFFPGMVISMTVWSINTIGDRLRDVVDRRLPL